MRSSASNARRVSVDGDDPFDLARFVSAQENLVNVALSELRRGRKRSHWMWFVFPQLAGLGRSSMARRFALHSVEEARAYLDHTVLGSRLIECCRALLSVEGRSASDIMGHPDDLKLRSSMTLFALVPGAPPVFRAVLEKYFEGRPDALTLEFLGSGSSESWITVSAPRQNNPSGDTPVH